MNPIHKYLRSLGLLLLVMIQSSCANDKTSLGEEPQSTPVKLARWLDDAGRVEALPDRYIAETEILRVEAAGKVKNPWAGWSGLHDRVTTRGRFSYSSSSLDFAMLSPWPTSVLWPGCIIPGGSLRGLDTPTPIPLLGKRKPGHILLQLSDLEQEHEQSLTLQEEVQDMRESSVLQAQSRLLDRLTNSGKPTALQKEKIEIDPRKVYRGTPFTYSIRSICSLEELAALSGLDVDRSIGILKRRLGTDFRHDKTYQLVHIYQPLYTLSYEPPQAGFSGILSDSLSVEDLKPFTGKGNPLCYISSVTYGHAYYLLVESSRSHLDLFQSLHSTLANLSYTGLYSNKPELDELKVSLLRVGAVSEDQVTRGKFSDAVNVIHRGSKFGKRHIGSPISFTVKHVYDSSPVRMSNTLKYNYDKTEFVPKQKEGRIAIMLNNISIHTSANSGWTTSNKGHALLKELSIRLHQTQGGELFNKPIAISSKRHGIKDPIYIPVYELYHERSPQGSYFNKITIYAEVEVKSSAYKFGDRTERDAQIVVLERTFSYNNGTWEPNDNGPEAYRKIKKSVKIGELNFELSLNFDFYLDSRLIHSADTPTALGADNTPQS